MIDKYLYKEVMKCFEMYLDEVIVLAENDSNLLVMCGWTYDEVINSVNQTKCFVKNYIETLNK